MSLARSRLLSPLVLFLAASVAPPQLFGDAIASVMVETDLPGASSCMLTSSGASIQCVSGNPSMPPTAEATGSASAGLGSLSLSLAAGTNGSGFARSTATASYNYEVVLPGASAGTIVGAYAVTASAAGDFGVFGNINLSQGSATESIPIEAPAPPIANPLLITSSYVAGQPVLVSGSMSAAASSPGEESASASAQLIGFFDPAGNPIPFSTVPEPAGWPVPGLCLALMWWRKRRGGSGGRERKRLI